MFPGDHEGSGLLELGYNFCNLLGCVRNFYPAGLGAVPPRVLLLRWIENNRLPVLTVDAVTAIGKDLKVLLL